MEKKRIILEGDGGNHVTIKWLIDSLTNLVQDAAKIEYDDSIRGMVRVSVGLMEIHQETKKLRGYILEEKRKALFRKGIKKVISERNKNHLSDNLNRNK